MSRRPTSTVKESAEQLLSRLTMTIEKAPIGVANVSPTGQWLMVNRHLCDILGYTEPELRKKTFQELTFTHDLEQDLANVERTLKGEIPGYSMEKRYVRKDGSIIWGHLSVSLMRTPDGTPDYFISIVEDITLRKRMEEELNRSQQRLQLLQTLPGVGSWELDFEVGKCSWSTETYNLLEQDRSLEPTLARFLELIHPEDREHVRQAVEDAMAGQKEYNVEFRVVPRPNRVKHIVARGRVFYNLGNPVLGGVAWEGRRYLHSLTKPPARARSQERESPSFSKDGSIR